MPHILNLKKLAASQQEPKEESPALTEPDRNEPDSPPNISLPSRIEWTAPEFEKKEKSYNWFFIGSLIMLALIAAAILIMQNFLFAIIILLAGIAVFLYSKKEPDQTEFTLTGEGIRINKTLYPYINLKSFWIFYDPPQKKYISIESKKLALPFIKIPLGEQDPVQARSFLIQFLPEKHQEESLVDTIARGLRF